MKKTLLVVGLIITLLGIGGVVSASWWGSDSPNTSNVNTYEQESAKTELNQRVLDKNQPLPTLTNSLERQNLINRLNDFNKPDKVSYIYLVSFGKVMAFYTIKGKVSSVNSMLSDPTQLIYGDGSQCDYGSNGNCYQVDSPDLDGSYGSNGNAIFFFTTNGTYVEWNGEYMLADTPLSLATPPELTMTVK
jgi:hypothetical protein